MIDEHCTAQLYACISYWSVLSLLAVQAVYYTFQDDFFDKKYHREIIPRFIVPILIVLGICGSLANLAIMSGSAFTGSTFYYLRALSLCDMFYLLCVIGTGSGLDIRPAFITEQ